MKKNEARYIQGANTRRMNLLNVVMNQILENVVLYCSIIQY